MSGCMMEIRARAPPDTPPRPALALRLCLLRYVLCMAIQMANTALANSKVKADARLARWLLMAHDRVTPVRDATSRGLSSRRSERDASRLRAVPNMTITVFAGKYFPQPWTVEPMPSGYRVID